MLYDRKIKYLDYLENGQRIQGAGYVKIERREGAMRLELAITGLRAADSCERDVLICSRREAKNIGKVVISNGRGQYRQQFQNLKDIGGTGISYEELQGIRIPVGAGREISSSWQPLQTKDAPGEMRAAGREGLVPGEKRDSGQEQPKELRNSEGIMGRSTGRALAEIRRQMDGQVHKKEVAGRKEEQAQISEGASEAGRMERKPAQRQGISRMQKEQGGEAGQEIPGAQEQRAESRKQGNKPEKPIRLLEDKWQQLCAIYPHIKPFQDAREYLSIGPSDFVLFPSASYKMVNNSFLLHGYYNYRHLILARLERKGEVVYYVGVPGSYFEKEKQVAIMFGFESFECAEEPAQPGDFGYYMMRTQL